MMSSSDPTSDLLRRQDQTGGDVHADHAHRQAALDTVPRHDPALRQPTQRLCLALTGVPATRARRALFGRQMQSRQPDDYPQRIDNPIDHHRSLFMIAHHETKRLHPERLPKIALRLAPCR